MSARATKAVILAAGQGKRMGSDLPKVLHPVDGKPMVIHCLEASMAAGIDDVILVVGVGRDEVIDAVDDAYDGVEYAFQDEQLGTGHAVIQARAFLDGFDGQRRRPLRRHAHADGGDDPRRSSTAGTRPARRRWSSPSSSRTRPTSGGSSATATAGSSASSRPATPRPSSWRCGRSTSGPTASTPPPCWAPSTGSGRTTPRASTTSPT